MRRSADSAEIPEAYARAIQLLREQLTRDPSQSANRSRLALHLAKTGDTETALAELAKVLTPDVVEVNTLFRGAVTYELAGRRDEALATLERALARGYGLIEIRMDPELATHTDVGIIAWPPSSTRPHRSGAPGRNRQH
jgi:serine/threonine-protein kinase